MNMKKFLAVALSVVVVGAIGTPAVISNAAGLTQATSPDEVNYGTITDADLAILESLFDLEYYIEANPDLVQLVGADKDKLFEHFCKCGIFEGRTCNPNFDPAAYASAYSDVKEAFGLDIIRYYRHYATVGLVENRTLTTIKACAEAGITVNTLSEQPIKITPGVYYLAEKIGTTDYKTVSTAVDRAYVQQKMAVIDTATGRYVVSSNKDLEKLKGLTPIGTVKAGNATLTYYIYDNSTGTAIYDGDIDAGGNVVETFKTSDADVIVTSADYKGQIILTVDTYSKELSDDIVEEINANKTEEEIPQVTGLNNHDSGTYIVATENEYIKDGNNIISLRTNTDNVSGVRSNQANPNGVGRYAEMEDYYVGGTVDSSGTKTPIPYAIGTQEYRQYITDNEIVTFGEGRGSLYSGRVGWSFIDNHGDENTAYTVCAGVEEEGTSKDITIGVYNEQTGFSWYNSIQIPNSSSDAAQGTSQGTSQDTTDGTPQE